MSWTAKYQLRISEQDVGRPAPHMRTATYSHHTFDSVSNMRHCDLGLQRQRPIAAGMLSTHSKSFNVGETRNLRPTQGAADTFAESDTRHDATSGIMKLKTDHPSMTSLTLWNEDLSTKMCHWIADGLRQTTHLTHLDIRYCKIGDEGCRVLAEGLKANQTLTSLQIKPNTVSKDVGQKWLSRALAHGGWVATNDTISHVDPNRSLNPVYVRPAQSLALR